MCVYLPSIKYKTSLLILVERTSIPFKRKNATYTVNYIFVYVNNKLYINKINKLSYSKYMGVQ